MFQLSDLLTFYNPHISGATSLFSPLAILVLVLFTVLTGDIMLASSSLFNSPFSKKEGEISVCSIHEVHDA